VVGGRSERNWDSRRTGYQRVFSPRNCAQSVPENIENYRKISKSIEIWKAFKRGGLQGKTLIFCVFASTVAAYTR
jgi:hypothetical protein